MYPFGLIGNCQIASLINGTGGIDWLCLPRPDSSPVFGRLLDPDGGHFSIGAVADAQTRQSYIPNSNILNTSVVTQEGQEFQITDFCPRFEQHGRMFRPVSLFRVVRPVRGAASIRVVCRPVGGWSKEPLSPLRGNSHLDFALGGDFLRVTTNMPLTYLLDETPFVLNEPLYFALTWNQGIEDDLAVVAETFLKQTVDYWRIWVKHCSIPSHYQAETIRSALTLKLHCYEDTGAILAAMTTSLPEEFGGSRNWDYRYCWLRDSAFVLSSFHKLGHFEEMEGFLKYLLNIASVHKYSQERLQPVYALDQSLPLPEREHQAWAGYKASRPIRSNNQAAEHVQNDVYGEMILTLAPIFFDERFQHLRTKEHEGLLLNLAQSCVQSIGQSDAGLWELRNGWQEHSFSNVMCWAGLERLERIHKAGFLKDIKIDFKDALQRVRDAITRAVKSGSLRNGPQDDSFDAALLLLPLLNYPDPELNRQSVLAIAEGLKLEVSDGLKGYLYRYKRADDFGAPKSAFMICSFWLAQALARVGEQARAIEVMDGAMQAANGLGLFAEHFVPGERKQCGNFPQAYSHVGQINAAFAISPPWEQIL